MAANPSFAATPRLQTSLVSAANTARDGSGTTVNVFTAGATGSRVERIIIKGTANIAAGSVVLFITDGTTTRVYREFTVTAITASTTVASYENIQALGIALPTGYSLLASTTVAQNFHITIEGADF